MSKKNKQMLKTFINVLKNNQKEINLVVPNIYVHTIYDIDYKYLKKSGYDYLLFDVDNTITEVNSIIIDKKVNVLINKLKGMGFVITLISNNTEKRVKPVAKELDVLYISSALKPNREALIKTLNVLKCEKGRIAVIGDQMLSDIRWANRNGLFSIMVEPYKNKYDIKTGTSRMLQNIMLKKLKKRNIMERYKYYKR